MKIALLSIAVMAVAGVIQTTAAPAATMSPNHAKASPQSRKTVGTAAAQVAEDPRDAPGPTGEGSSEEGLNELRHKRLQEVIVTAQKRSQPAFDVPISMAVIGGPELEKTEIHSLDSLENLVSGVAVDATGEQRRIDIRGVSNLFGQAALIGMYLDEADVTLGASNSLDLDVYDLARVEVLKGPQGTLYGEGSLGGTVRFIPNGPALDRFQMNADVSALFDQYGAPGQRTVAVVNIPLLQSTLGLRVAGDFDHQGGWEDQPAGNLKNINSDNLADVRIEGLWKPFKELEISAMQVIHRNTFGPFFGEDANGRFTQVLNLLTTPHTQDNFNLSNLTLSWNMQGVRLLNSATYLTRDLNITDYGLSLPELAPPEPIFQEYYSPREQNEDWSDELRLTRTGQGPWQWTVGGFYRHYTDVFPPVFFYFGLLGAPGSPLPPTYPFNQTSRSNSKSGFADTSYRIMGHLTVGAGVRYFSDEEAFLASGEKQIQGGTFTSADPRFYLRYGVSEKINLYASAAKGFRSGGFNSLGQAPYEPETAWTYEFGTKMRFLDKGVTTNADVFLTNYSRYQIIGILPPPALPIAITTNAGTARIKGIEADVAWSPTDSWMLTLNGDYLDARFVDISALRSSYNLGDSLDMVFRYTVNASAQRDFTWNGRSGFIRMDYSQRPPDSYRNRLIGPWFYSASDHIYMLNYNSGIQWNPNLRLGFFVQNLLNDRGKITADSIENTQMRARPRTFGAEFNVKFE